MPRRSLEDILQTNLDDAAFLRIWGKATAGVRLLETFSDLLVPGIQTRGQPMKLEFIATPRKFGS